MPDNRSKFSTATAAYPFKRWHQSGLEQYTKESCAAFSHIFDSLISRLVDLGEHATEQAKLEAIQHAVEQLNVLNEQDESLIETGEREELCELVNLITSASGLDPKKYGDGEGPATEWRQW